MKKLLYIIMPLLLLSGCDPEPDKAGSTYGTVSDKSTGDLVPVAYVSLVPGGKSTETGTDGRYEFTDLKAGEYTVEVKKESYKDTTRIVTITAGSSNKVDIQIERIPAIITVDKDTLDFGESANLNTLSFSIVNQGYQTLEWSVEQNCSWVKEVKPASGSLEHSITATVIVVIDREKLSGGNNETVIVVKSSNGKSEITLKAIGENKSLPRLNTLPITAILPSTAVFNGEITFAGSPPYTERGFVYATTPMPTIENTIAKLTAPVTQDTIFSAHATGLLLNQDYYVRAYAINSMGVAYSTNEESFKIVMMMELQADGLMVQKYDISSGLDWTSANNQCKSSRVGGYSDWRLPTQGELQALYDKRVEIGNFTTNEERSRYWSSTTSSSGYIHVNFYNGYYHISNNSDTYRVRCVRTLLK